MKNLREIRKRAGLTQIQLAAEANTSQALISHWERGGVDAKALSAIAVAGALNRHLPKGQKVSIQEIMGVPE